MTSCVDDGEQQHGIRHLSVEPHRLVERQEAHLGSDDTEDVPAHGHDDDHGVDGKHKTSASRDPDGELQSIKRRKTNVTLLFPPARVSGSTKARRDDDAYHPIPNMAQWKPQKKKLKASFRGVKKPCQTDSLPIVSTSFFSQTDIKMLSLSTPMRA